MGEMGEGVVGDGGSGGEGVEEGEGGGEVVVADVEGDLLVDGVD